MTHNSGDYLFQQGTYSTDSANPADYLFQQGTYSTDSANPAAEILDRLAPPPKAKRKPARAREAEVLAAVLKYLKSRGIFHWRQNTGGAVYGGRRVSFAIPGMADIVGILPGGFFLAIECKRPGRDATSPRRKARQARFAERVQAAGGVYLRATSVDDVRPVVDAFIRSFRHGQAVVSKHLAMGDL